MEHFHLSQGDKPAGLERPLYLQKKIKSALTLAPLIRNTCWLVIVLNSFWSRSRAFAPAPGTAVEFAWNSFPPGGSRRGHSWARVAEERRARPRAPARPGLRFSRKAVPPPRPLPLASHPSSGAWGGSKHSRPSWSPTGSPPARGFHGGGEGGPFPQERRRVFCAGGAARAWDCLRSSNRTVPGPLRTL